MSSPMTDLSALLRDLRALYAASTQGRWREFIGSDGSFSIEDENLSAILCSRAPWNHRAAENTANAAFIAAIHTAFPALAERIEALERENDALREANRLLQGAGADFLDAVSAALPHPPKEPL